MRFLNWAWDKIRTQVHSDPDGWWTVALLFFAAAVIGGAIPATVVGILLYYHLGPDSIAGLIVTLLTMPLTAILIFSFVYLGKYRRWREVQQITRRVMSLVND